MNWLLLGIAGGFIGLDATSFPQAMISRPLVAATIAGWLMGDAAAGAVLGVILEVLTFVVLPVGASRYPESGTAAAAAGAAFVAAGGSTGDTPLLLMAALFALGWERVTGMSVVLGRQANERLVEQIAASPAPARAVVRTHTLALAIDYLRGVACVTIGALAGVLLLGFFGPRFHVPADATAGVIAIAACAMLGAGLTLFGGWRERRLAFGLGILCGLLLMFAA